MLSDGFEQDDLSSRLSDPSSDLQMCPLNLASFERTPRLLDLSYQPGPALLYDALVDQLHQHGLIILGHGLYSIYQIQRLNEFTAPLIGTHHFQEP
jgi:hypothetical protein